MAVSGAKSNSEAAANQQQSTGETAEGQVLPTATKVELAAATMLGDIRDPILDQFRLLDQPWSKLKAHEQRRVVANVERICRESITQMVGIFSRVNFHAVEAERGAASLEGEKIKLKIELDKDDDTLLAVSHATRLTLVFADAKTFLGEREAAKVDPDQPNIPFPETGEGDATAEDAERETAPGGIPLDQAEQLFEKSREAAEEKKARSRQRRGTTAASDPEPAGDQAEAEMPTTPREPVEA